MLEIGLYSAVAPLILLLVSSVWVYPAILEEAVKWAILRLLTPPQAVSALRGAVVGLVFGLSEAVLYSLNGWSGAQWGPMLDRLLLTIPMHTVTGGVIGYSMRRGWGVIGVIVGLIVHAMFNRNVAIL